MLFQSYQSSPRSSERQCNCPIIPFKLRAPANALGGGQTRRKQCQVTEVENSCPYKRMEM
jgi:hypothetical protein